MKKHKVSWLEVERDARGVAVGLGENDRWRSREFSTFEEAERFAMELQRKHPTPVEYSEID